MPQSTGLKQPPIFSRSTIATGGGPNSPMNYGRAIRLVRSARDLSQKELAKRLKKDPSYLSLLERNERDPSAETLKALAEALAIPLYLLVFLASDPKDLRGIPAEEAQAFGQALLRVFTRDLSKKMA